MHMSSAFNVFCGLRLTGADTTCQRCQSHYAYKETVFLCVVKAEKEIRI